MYGAIRRPFTAVNDNIMCEKGHLPLVHLGPMYRCEHPKQVPSTMSQ